MGKIRRGNYVFITWKGDHGPNHVHVYNNPKLVTTRDLEPQAAMKGRPTARILELIRQLEKEGAL